MNKVKEEIERVQIEAEQARRRGDLGRVSELLYGRLPQLRKQVQYFGQVFFSLF